MWRFDVLFCAAISTCSCTCEYTIDNVICSPCSTEASDASVYSAPDSHLYTTVYTTVAACT
jgi:hypothetical protein